MASPSIDAKLEPTDESELSSQSGSAPASTGRTDNRLHFNIVNGKLVTVFPPSMAQPLPSSGRQQPQPLMQLPQAHQGPQPLMQMQLQPPQRQWRPAFLRPPPRHWRPPFMQRLPLQHQQQHPQPLLQLQPPQQPQPLLQLQPQPLLQLHARQRPQALLDIKLRPVFGARVAPGARVSTSDVRILNRGYHEEHDSHVSTYLPGPRYVPSHRKLTTTVVLPRTAYDTPLAMDEPTRGPMSTATVARAITYNQMLHNVIDDAIRRSQSMAEDECDAYVHRDSRYTAQYTRRHQGTLSHYRLTRLRAIRTLRQPFTTLAPLVKRRLRCPHERCYTRRFAIRYRPRELTEHSIEHNDDRTVVHKCAQCAANGDADVYFESMVDQSFHSRRYHDAGRFMAMYATTSCAICGRIYGGGSKTEVDMHMKRHDARRGAYMCAMGCARTYFASATLRLHHYRRSHTEGSLVKFDRPVDIGVFRAAAPRHVRTELMRAVRPPSTPYCVLCKVHIPNVARDSHLLAHRPSTGEGQWKCRRCNLFYESKDKLNGHQRAKRCRFRPLLLPHQLSGDLETILYKRSQFDV